jgi:hypothetical protein
MADNDLAGDVPANPALQRVLRQVGTPELVDLLADGMTGADLTTLLLEVFRRRAEQLSPAQVMRRYCSNRFVAPASISFTALRRTEDALLSELPDGFEVLVLAPVLPLAAHSAVATVDPRKVIATVRGSEVAADPTNALALEASLRRSRALATDPRSSEPVRLAAGVSWDAAGFLADVARVLAHVVCAFLRRLGFVARRAASRRAASWPAGVSL